MGSKTKVAKQKGKAATTQTQKFEPVPLGKPAFFGKQEQLFDTIGDALVKRLKNPLASPEFATGRDFLSRRSESLKKRVRGTPSIFAGLRKGAVQDIDSSETRALSDLIRQITQAVGQNAFNFATTGVGRGGVGVTSRVGTTTSSGQISTPGSTFLNSVSERLPGIIAPTLADAGGGQGVAALASVGGRGGGASAGV